MGRQALIALTFVFQSFSLNSIFKRAVTAMLLTHQETDPGEGSILLSDAWTESP